MFLLLPSFVYLYATRLVMFGGAFSCNVHSFICRNNMWLISISSYKSSGTFKNNIPRRRTGIIIVTAIAIIMIIIIIILISFQQTYSNTTVSSNQIRRLEPASISTVETRRETIYLQSKRLLYHSGFAAVYGDAAELYYKTPKYAYTYGRYLEHHIDDQQPAYLYSKTRSEQAAWIKAGSQHRMKTDYDQPRIGGVREGERKYQHGISSSFSSMKGNGRRRRRWRWQ